MQKMKLRANIKLENDGTLTARSKMHDGTEFKLKVGKYDVYLNEEFTNSMREVTGMIDVTQLSVQDTRAYIKLPVPTIEHGSNVTVNKYMLNPPKQSIEQFKAVPNPVPQNMRAFVDNPIADATTYKNITPDQSATDEPLDDSPREEE